MIDELVAWLRAQLDDDEALADLASPGPWHLGPDGDEVIAADDIEVATVFALGNRQLRNTAAYIARHDPVRVLREVEVKRRILDELVSYDTPRGDGEEAFWHMTGHGYARFKVLRLLALPYADRPGYREEWRP